MYPKGWCSSHGLFGSLHTTTHLTRPDYKGPLPCTPRVGVLHTEYLAPFTPRHTSPGQTIRVPYHVPQGLVLFTRTIWLPSQHNTPHQARLKGSPTTYPKGWCCSHGLFGSLHNTTHLTRPDYKGPLPCTPRVGVVHTEYLAPFTPRHTSPGQTIRVPTMYPKGWCCSHGLFGSLHIASQHNTPHQARQLSLVHTSDGDGSTKFHTNSVKRRRNRRERKGFFSSVPSPFYRVCMEFCASVSVSPSVSVASVNQA